MQEQIRGPVLLRPIAQERVWGADTLPGWYPQPLPGKPIGEVWLTAAECAVESAADHGSTLGELVESSPELFAGGSTDGFPLLVKILFPREKLSVQVHPNNAQAQAMGQPRGKTECWYVLSAEPGAQVALGFRRPVGTEEIQTAIATGTLEDKLHHVPVKAGDMIYVDAGTVHAIGPGMVVLETQQYSDTTYRLYDYGRPRELHLEAGLAVTRSSTEAGLVLPVVMDGFSRLIASPHFVVDLFAVEGADAALGKRGELQILVALDDGCFLESSGGTALPLLPGRAVVLPAADVRYTLRSAFPAQVVRIAQA